MAAPIVILSTGQSNVSRHPAYSWTPQPNLYLWNHDGIVDAATHTGTAFAAMDATTMGYDYSYADEAAKANPAASVYLVKIGQGSLAIAQWMAGAAAPDMYACCKNNIQAALTAIGVTEISKFLWWQGESDAMAGSTTYSSDFNTVIVRFRAETWFPYSTPITIMGTSFPYGAPLDAFNNTLSLLASIEPERRKFVNTGSLNVAFWDPAFGYTHMNAAGYEQAGRLAFAARRAVMQGVYANPLTGCVTFTGGVSRGAPVTKTTDFTVADTDNSIICNKPGWMTVTLPIPATCPGRELEFLNRQAFGVVSPTSNVVGKNTGVLNTGILGATAGAWVKIVSDGANWVMTQAG